MKAVSFAPSTFAGSNLFTSTSFEINDLTEMAEAGASSSVINVLIHSKLFSTSLFVSQKSFEQMKYFGRVIDNLCLNTAGRNNLC